MPKAPETPRLLKEGCAPKAPSRQSSSPEQRLKAHIKPTAPSDVLLSIILARMEDTKSFDWVGLAESLNGKGIGKDEGKKTPVKGKEKGGRRITQKKTIGDSELSGGGLRDLYYDIILPKLRAGQAPWNDLFSSPTSSPLPGTPVDDLNSPEFKSSTDHDESPKMRNKRAARDVAEGKMRKMQAVHDMIVSSQDADEGVTLVEGDEEEYEDDKGCDESAEDEEMSELDVLDV